MRTVRVTALVTGLSTICLGLAAPAFAGGKAAGGCSPPYVLATYNNTGNLYVNGVIDQRTANLLSSGVVTPAEAYALFQSLDHNADSALCIKVPSGWDQPNNGANRDDYVNIVDDKIVS